MVEDQKKKGEKLTSLQKQALKEACDLMMNSLYFGRKDTPETRKNAEDFLKRIAEKIIQHSKEANFFASRRPPLDNSYFDFVQRLMTEGVFQGDDRAAKRFVDAFVQVKKPRLNS